METTLLKVRLAVIWVIVALILVSRSMLAGFNQLAVGQGSLQLPLVYSLWGTGATLGLFALPFLCVTLKDSPNRWLNILAGFFFTIEVALQFDIDVVASVDVNERFDAGASGVGPTFTQRGGERATFISGETDQALRVFAQVGLRGGDDGGIAVLRSTHLHARDQAAEVLVAVAVANNEWTVDSGRWTERVLPTVHRPLSTCSDFRANVRL